MAEAYQDGFTTWAMHDGDWDTGEHTLLHWACDGMKLQELNLGGKPSLNIVKKLVLSGIDPNARGQQNCLPLNLIAKSSDDEAIEILKYLLAHGADPKLSNDYGYTALHEAASWGSPIAIETLLDYDADFHALTGQRETALELAKKGLVEAKVNGKNGVTQGRYKKAVEILATASSHSVQPSEFDGFFYWGNRHTKPMRPELMSVADMLNSEKLKKWSDKMTHQTRWFHLPANNVSSPTVSLKRVFINLRRDHGSR